MGDVVCPLAQQLESGWSWTDHAYDGHKHYNPLLGKLNYEADFSMHGFHHSTAFTLTACFPSNFLT